MSWWHDQDNQCSYEEWVVKCGGLIKVLDSHMQQHPAQLSLEFGTGNTTRVLSKRSARVVSMDINSDSIIVPVDEQPSLHKSQWARLKKEDNVEFIHADFLRYDFYNLRNYNPDFVLLDVGSSVSDKYLYRILYDRLKANECLSRGPILFIDNASYCEDFIAFLSYTEKYIIERYETDQAIARK